MKLFLCVLLALIVTAACSNGGKLGKYSNEEILAKYKTCSESEPSGTYAITCSNIIKECERRKRNGKNVCRMRS